MESPRIVSKKDSTTNKWVFELIPSQYVVYAEKAAPSRTSRGRVSRRQVPKPKPQVMRSIGYMAKVKLIMGNYLRETMLRWVGNLKKAMLCFVSYLMMTAWVIAAIIGTLHSLTEILGIINSHGVIAVSVLAVAAFFLREEISVVLEQVKRVEAKVDVTSAKFTKCIEILKKEKLRIIWRLL